MPWTPQVTGVQSEKDSISAPLWRVHNLPNPRIEKTEIGSGVGPGQIWTHTPTQTTSHLFLFNPVLSLPCIPALFLPSCCMATHHSGTQWALTAQMSTRRTAPLASSRLNLMETSSSTWTWRKKETVWRLPEFNNITMFEIQSALRKHCYVKKKFGHLDENSNFTPATNGKCGLSSRYLPPVPGLLFPSPG